MNARMKAEPWPRSIMSGSPINWSMPRVPSGCGPKPVFHSVDPVALDVGERPLVGRHDELIHRRMGQVAADQIELLVRVAPPLR